MLGWWLGNQGKISEEVLGIATVASRSTNENRACRSTTTSHELSSLSVLVTGVWPRQAAHWAFGSFLWIPGSQGEGMGDEGEGETTLIVNRKWAWEKCSQLSLPWMGKSGKSHIEL
jgi:hypothetical protein